MDRNRRHITILVANLPAERDRRVIRECLTLEADGYEVTVIAPRGQRGLRVLPGSRGTRIRSYPLVIQGSGGLTFAVEFVWSFLCIGALLLGEVLRGRAHAVQVCNPPDVYWPLAVLMRGIGRPWVFDHHDLCPEVYATRSGRGPGAPLFRGLILLEWLTLRTASAVIATNESYRENALRRGVAPHRITVVRNGPARAEVGDDTGPSVAHPPEHHIVYLGVLGPQDNVAGAVLAAERLATLRGRHDWRMTIAGDGETLPQLRDLVAERGLGDLISFPGWLDAHEVDALLRTASVAIQPDLPTRMNHLSTMAKTIEYLARGVPVVAVDLTETRRSAADAAVYVPTGDPAEFADALAELLDDPTRRKRMSEVGLSRFAEQLAWDHQAARYLAVWRSVLRRRRDRTAPAVADPSSAGAERSAGESHDDPVAVRRESATSDRRPAGDATVRQ